MTKTNKFYNVAKLILISIVLILPLVQNANALTSVEQTNIDITQQRLSTAELLDYIATTSADNGVPPEIIYGLITVESGGRITADSGLANGVMQITESTYNDPSFTFSNKCPWEEYKIDKECQVLAGIKYVKQLRNQVGSSTVYYQCNQNCWGNSLIGGKITLGYWPTCLGECLPHDPPCIGPVNKVYTGWEAALRRYNGGGGNSPPLQGAQSSGCTFQPDYDYVEKVMTYANGWKDVLAKSSTSSTTTGTTTTKTTTPSVITQINGPVQIAAEQKFLYDCKAGLRQNSDWIQTYPNGYDTQIKIAITSDLLDAGGYTLNRQKYNTGLTESDMVIVYSKTTRMVNVLYGKNINVQKLQLDDVTIKNAFNGDICKGFKQFIETASKEKIII